MAITDVHVRRIDPKRAYPLTAMALAQKWGKAAGLDPEWVRAHELVESSDRPLARNERGNAWGMMQVKPATAETIVAWMRSSGLAKHPKIAKVLRQWRGRPEDLLNPELNVLLGAAYLRLIKERLGTQDHATVAAAYNQGPGAVRKALAAQVRAGEGGPDLMPEHMTEAMRAYVERIEEAKERA